MSEPVRPMPDGAGVPPGAVPPLYRAMRRLVRPVEDFLALEAASGVVLTLVTVLALVWANSPWRDSYEAVWTSPLGVHLGPWSFESTLRLVIDEGLMTIFFFVVGLEIRREMSRGELSEWRRAALPLAAALGGMVVPALIYAAIHAGHATQGGWGVPMATDIAFAVGVLTLLGKRVPPALRILLLALAVIDDVGAILVIGLAYSSGFHWSGAVIAVLGMVGIFVLQAIGARRNGLYAIPSVVIWVGLHHAGVHATLAGVLVGLMTPAQPWVGRERLVDALLRVTGEVREEPPADLGRPLERLWSVGHAAIAPVDSLQRALHGFVAFFVMPVFALANSGVRFADVSLGGDEARIALGIAVALVVGKLAGIVGGSALAVRLGLAALPTGVTWRGVVVVALAGGIGFTMSLFIADLAFHEEAHDAAKVGILAASLAAALLAFGVGRRFLPAAPSGGARTATEAESSTEH